MGRASEGTHLLARLYDKFLATPAPTRYYVFFPYLLSYLMILGDRARFCKRDYPKKMIRFPSHSSSQRQPQQESSALPQFAAGAEAAAMCPGYGLGDRQSQSRTAGIAGSIAVDSVESIEYSL